MPVALTPQDEVCLHAVGYQRFHDLQCGDATPNHHGGLAPAGQSDDSLSIVHVIQLDHTFQVRTGDGHLCGQGARGNEQPIVAVTAAVLQRHLVRQRVNRYCLGVNEPEIGRVAKEQILPPYFPSYVVRQTRATVETVRVIPNQYQLPGRILFMDDASRGGGGGAGTDNHIAECDHLITHLAAVGRRSKERTPRGQRDTHSPQVRQ